MAECPNCGEDDSTVISLNPDKGDDLSGPVETYESKWKCLQCHTVVTEGYSPAKCVVCLLRIWWRPETLSNGQLVHDFCRTKADPEGGAEK